MHRMLAEGKFSAQVLTSRFDAERLHGDVDTGVFGYFQSVLMADNGTIIFKEEGALTVTEVPVLRIQDNEDINLSLILFFCMEDLEHKQGTIG